MFRELRRKKQALSAGQNVEILMRATSGVLAVCGDDGRPYAVPLSYVYHQNKLFFHCAPAGHKLDAIGQNPKVSFCVIDQDRIVPAEYTSYFRSVIVFGTARVLRDADEKRRALGILAAKYSPEHEQGRLQEIEKTLERVCLVEIAIEHMSGKQALELTGAE